MASIHNGKNYGASLRAFAHAVKALLKSAGVEGIFGDLQGQKKIEEKDEILMIRFRCDSPTNVKF